MNNQLVQCTVSYTREIRQNVLKSSQEILWGEKEDGYPDVVLKSERKWRVNLLIKKSFPSSESFVLSGDTCLNDEVELSIPECYADLKHQWTYDRSIGSISKIDGNIFLFTRRANAIFLTTSVRCNVSDCAGNTRASSIRLRTANLPKSTLSFDDCLSTEKNQIEVTASNITPGVSFEWEGVPVLKVLHSDSYSQKISYPSRGVDDFAIRLITHGGCYYNATEAIVHRTLGNNISLKVLDSCPTTGIPFRMSTNPPLPNMNLKWGVPNGYTVLMSVNGRKDMATITKPSGLGQTVSIKIQDTECGGSTTDYVSISEAYTDFVARTVDGRILQSGDTVDSGTRIILTAPQHSSITGNYTWSSYITGGTSSSLAKNWQGTAEATVTAPASEYSISVTVSYVSCRGKESKTLVFHSQKKINKGF
ncbi:MAG: hypothetical protein NC048_05010 [Bacteroides sp.]|nr:hypothetical protein [Ruminococcus flavefaciens]MCM1554837.1 hypothetical protein [Bacteroides sp.]